MAEYKILCPACSSILSSKKPIPNGKKITCPHCQKPFVAATAEVGPPPGSSSGEFEFDASAPAAPGPAPRNDPPHKTEKPHKSVAKSSSKSGTRTLALLTVIVGLATLVGAGGFAIYFFYIKPATETPVVTKGTSKKTDSKGDDKRDAKTVAQTPSKAKNPGAGKEEKSAKGREKETGSKAENKNNDAKTDGVKPAVAVAPAKPKAPEWKEYKSAKGGYAVEFPAKPGEHLSRDADVIHYETKADLGGTEYDITFYRLKKDELNVAAKDRLNGIAEELKAQTKEKKEIMVAGQPALELQMLLGDMKILAFQRWLVYKEHVFNISVSGDKERLGPDEVTRFLDSFRFVADPEGGFVDPTKEGAIPEQKKKK